MTARVIQQYLKILLLGDQAYNLFLMLERWSFSFTLSEKGNIFSTFQKIEICFFIPKCYRSYPGSCCWSHLGRGWGKQIDHLTRWKQSHNFTNFFARFHETGGKFYKAKKYATVDSIVYKKMSCWSLSCFYIMTITMNEKTYKLNQPWAAAPTDDVSAKLATCTRNLFQDELK